ncbi:MAG: DUF6754 domain-containing protein [Halobacteria archaeon]|nr:hypothetical protein [Candidatus Bathyarchaeota archaeon]
MKTLIIEAIRQLIFPGRTTQLVVLLIFSIVILVGIWLGSRGKEIELRPLPAINAMVEAIGRAAELGKPIHFNPGWYSLDSVEAPQTVAALSIFNYIMKHAVEADVRVITTLIRPDIIPLIDDIMRSAYAASGKLESYRSDDIRYISGEQFAYIGGVAKIFREESPAATIALGGFMAYSLLLMETAHSYGQFKIGGTASWHQIPFFAATADYVLIGEELYAAGAYTADDPYLKGSILGQDIEKIITILLLIVGMLLSALRSTLFFDFLRW